MRFGSLLTVLAFAIYAAGCAPQQPYMVAPQINDAGSQGAQVGTSSAAADASASVTDAHPVYFARASRKGHLLDGDPSELPPAVASALSKDAPLTFFYREELTHDEYHIPTIVSAFDPVTYLGAPLGDYGVTASASLTISEGNRVIADYTAKAHVSKSYNVYSEPKHPNWSAQRATRFASASIRSSTAMQTE